jgi:ABC-type transporter Mla subunit MlaD
LFYKLRYGGFELSSSETTDGKNFNDFVNKATDVNQILSLLSGEEIELAKEINDKAENLKAALNNLDDLMKDDFSSFFENIVVLNDSINKVLNDAINMELMFQTKLDRLNDSYVFNRHDSSKSKATDSSADEHEKRDT